MRFVAMLLVFVTPVVLAAPIPKSILKSANNKNQLVGEWLEPQDKKRGWWFKDDGTAGGGDIGKPQRKGLYRSDSSVTPMTLDWSNDDGKTWQLGIYSLESNTLKVAIGNSITDVRPENYETHPRSYVISATRK